jgi:ATP-dependent Clp protease ATP-binding subunit ClpA
MDRATPFMNAAGSASRALGHDYIATEHLLLALAQDYDSAAAQMLAREGLSTDEIRGEILTLIGACDSPRGQLDGDALATLGIDLDEVRRHVERAFGHDALERTWAACTPVAPRL